MFKFRQALPPQPLLSLLLLLLCTSYGCRARQLDFQVAQPPPGLPNTAHCTVRILERTFASSFGDPEVVNFTPPTDCGDSGTWAAISLNFTVTTDGALYDRLGIFTLQNVEIWRTYTVTPVPVEGDGIYWTYVKDVSRFLPLFSEAGTLILQLNNTAYTIFDQYAATLEATFFASSPDYPPAPRADLIVPLTPLDDNNTGNVASVPLGFSHEVTLPTNAVSAFVELQASGDRHEEFWYLNAPNQTLGDLPDGITYGEGPFREVRVLVDGQLAGAAFPFAVISPGGITPSAWRPITAYGALDLPTYNLDLTAFIPTLTDGKPHNVTLDVASAEPGHDINQNWYISGCLQVKLDSSNTPTTGKITRYEATDFATSSVSVTKSDADMDITVNASRRVYIEAEIIAGSGARTEVVFSQDLNYTIVQSYLDNFSKQNIFQLTSGQVLSKHNDDIALQDDFAFPLMINLTVSPNYALDLVQVDHWYNRTLIPAPFIPGSTIWVYQFVDSENNNNTLYYKDAAREYTRQVNVSDGVITVDTGS